jgi:hypothetical protein
LAAIALPAMFVLLLVIGAPLGEHRHPTSTRAGSSRDTITAAETPMTPTLSSTEQTERFPSSGALVAYLVVAASIALALWLRFAAGASPWILLPRTGLTRQERAPPVACA